MGKKYEITKEWQTMKVIGNDGKKTLHRIKALTDFGNVKKGDFGGFVENESNLSQEGDCWIFDNAMCFGNAMVYENAIVYENACVHGNAMVYENASIRGSAKVYGLSRICGHSIILDSAKVYGNTTISGNAIIGDNSRIYGNAVIYGNSKILGRSRIFGNAVLGNVESSDYARIYGDVNISDNIDICDDANIKNNKSFLYISCAYGKITIFRTITNKIIVKNHLQKWVLEDFEKEVNTFIETKPNAKYLGGLELLSIIQLAKVYFEK